MIEPESNIRKFIWRPPFPPLIYLLLFFKLKDCYFFAIHGKSWDEWAGSENCRNPSPVKSCHWWRGSCFPSRYKLEEVAKQIQNRDLLKTSWRERGERASREHTLMEAWLPELLGWAYVGLGSSQSANISLLSRLQCWGPAKFFGECRKKNVRLI